MSFCCFHRVVYVLCVSVLVLWLSELCSIAIVVLLCCYCCAVVTQLLLCYYCSAVATQLQLCCAGAVIVLSFCSFYNSYVVLVFCYAVMRASLTSTLRIKNPIRNIPVFNKGDKQNVTPRIRLNRYDISKFLTLWLVVFFFFLPLVSVCCQRYNLE